MKRVTSQIRRHINCITDLHYLLNYIFPPFNVRDNLTWNDVSIAELSLSALNVYVCFTSLHRTHSFFFCFALIIFHFSIIFLAMNLLHINWMFFLLLSSSLSVLIQGKKVTINNQMNDERTKKLCINSL